MNYETEESAEEAALKRQLEDCLGLEPELNLPPTAEEGCIDCNGSGMSRGAVDYPCSTCCRTIPYAAR